MFWNFSFCLQSKIMLTFIEQDTCTSLSANYRSFLDDQNTGMKLNCPFLQVLNVFSGNSRAVSAAYKIKAVMKST